MFAATEQGIWRSDDGGQTWAEKTQGLPWKQIQGFAGGSDAAKKLVMLYCSIRSQDENGVFKGGIYRSRDRGETWESAMGRGPQHRRRRRPTNGPTVPSRNTTNCSPPTRSRSRSMPSTPAPASIRPHSDTVYRSDDGGETWRATYFQDPRFKRLQRRARTG